LINALSIKQLYENETNIVTVQGVKDQGDVNQDCCLLRLPWLFGFRFQVSGFRCQVSGMMNTGTIVFKK